MVKISPCHGVWSGFDPRQYRIINGEVDNGSRAVLKTVGSKGFAGSNPVLSAPPILCRLEQVKVEVSGPYCSVAKLADAPSCLGDGDNEIK